MTLEELITYVSNANIIPDRLVFDALGLAGEAGEVANKVKKLRYYPNYPQSYDDIIDEMSDVLFHLYSLCMIVGINLENLSEYVVNKQQKRWNINITEQIPEERRLT